MASFTVASKEVTRLSSRSLYRNASSRDFQTSARILAAQKYPLTPSVSQTLHENGISQSEVDKIPASGPKGRLLKGDVLAYVGTIKSSYSSDQSARITHLAHLDLSNIKIAPPKSMEPPPSSTMPSDPKAAAPAPEPDTEIAVSISFKAVLEVQKRLQTTLGITLPLSTFIARATEVANDDLPRSTTTAPTANELFNQVLGLDKINSKTSRGSFTPQITALPARPFQLPAGPARKLDIIDLLTGAPSRSAPSDLGVPPVGTMAGSGSGAATNVFSVSVPRGEEKRARVFLERVKTILQAEPGRLIL
ncbi:pyridoxine biosynthesis protein [Toensbergia leucococca]|nr:pyridoxine biosynthesis protein [Toensbergia leucococca]